MKRYLNIYIMIITITAILVTAIICTYACYQIFCNEIFEDLKVHTGILHSINFREHPEDYEEYASRLEEEGRRLTLIDSEGNVLFDTLGVGRKYDNHMDRTEIHQAIESGEGHSVRMSTTSGITSYYYAARTDDGNILRISKEAPGLIHLFRSLLPVIIVTLALVIIVCLAMVNTLTRNVVDSIENMAQKLDHPEEIHTYRELDTILRHIQLQHQSIMDHANLRQEFTANISHELKTPLTSISGYSELIENGLTDPEDTRKFGAEIHQSANRLLTLINDILRLSELDITTSSDLYTEDVDLFELASSCAGMLELNARMQQVSISVEGSSTVIRANRDMIEEIIYNLYDNAIRYNHPGGYVKALVEEGQITVSDNGIGIPDQYQERVFERFFRVDKSRSKKTGGTGLGLAIVKHIVTLHGAELTLESRENEGTRISIRFPA